MKKSLLVIIGTIIGLPFITKAQINNLNIPDDLVMVNQPVANKAMVFTVVVEEEACIQIYASNPSSQAKKLNTGSKTRMDTGKKSNSIAIVKLQSVSDQDGAKSFNFGRGCAEQNADNANVLVTYRTDRATNNIGRGGNTSFKLNIPDGDILTVSSGSLPGNGNTSKNHLRINADRAKTATISIDEDARKGQVIIGVFRVQGNPNPLAVLDPKGVPSNRTVVVDQDVFVVPMIRPKLREISGKKNIIFEVGDPHENGRVEAEEEI